jgi:hypothetical protein
MPTIRVSPIPPTGSGSVQGATTTNAFTSYLQQQGTNAVKAFFGAEYLRDFQHASRAFQTNNYKNAPKYKFLFHVYFDINQDVYNVGLQQGANYGLAVKTVKLPSFNITTNELNQYNRKRIVQTKIKYDPIDITFHDDNGGPAGSPLSGGMIRKLWENYFRYYYNDSTKPNIQIGSRFLNTGQAEKSVNSFNKRTQYSDNVAGDADWGYKGETTNSTGVKTPFFKSINVFGFNQHNYVAYMLINPIITRFGHDTYAYAEGNGVMENQMTIDYETVVYDAGAISGTNPDAIALGFGDPANYDRTPSPITKPGTQNNIFGQSGLLDGGLSGISDLQNGNILGGIQKLGATAMTAKNMGTAGLKQAAVGELNQGLMNAVAPAPNRTGLTFPVSLATPYSVQLPTTISSPPTIR